MLAHCLVQPFTEGVWYEGIKVECERPDQYGRSLSQWDCTELALEMVAAGLVASISAASIRRILTHHKLKPWRHHLWLSAKLPSDQAFIASVEVLVSLYTRLLEPGEVVLCLDEKTSL